MAQPKFITPEFLQNNSAKEIHERMMKSLPGDIDDMPGGFPYDFTMPAALEKDELINFHLVRVLMLAFPQFAWNEWLDLHGQQVHLVRHPAMPATGSVLVSGETGTEILVGTVFCTPATGDSPSIEFESLEDSVIGEEGSAEIPVKAVEAGTRANVAANAVSLMARPNKHITAVTNPEPMIGGTNREGDDDFFDRIAAEYENSMTYLGNDSDYVRWAKAAGAGDCIVVPAWSGPGTVKLVLVDTEGKPASEDLIQTVYDYIVSEDDRTARLLPTGCAELACVAATTRTVSFTITGLEYEDTTDIDTIKADFIKAIASVFEMAKEGKMLRYNDARPVISDITGVKDFDTFLMDGDMKNIQLADGEYPTVGMLDFS